MSISKYSEFNKPLEPLPSTIILTEKLLIERAGGKENYELIKSSGIVENDRELYEFTGFLDTISFNRTFLVEVSAGIISPVAKKIGITKHSIIWYMFTYGIVHSLEELGSQMLNKDKSVDFCKAFSAGIAGSVKYWMSDKIFIKVLKFLGLPVSTSFLAGPIYHNIQDQILNPKYLTGIVDGIICGENFEVDGKKVTLWEMVYSYASKSLEELYNKYFK